MLKARTTMKLTFLAVVLAAILWSALRQNWHGPAAGGGRQALLGRMVDGVSSIVIGRGDREIELLRSRGKWMIVRPFNTGADGEKVEALLDRLARVERKGVVTDAQRRKRDLDFGDFGLSAPTGRVVVASRSMRVEILIGNPSPLGDAVYARLGGSDNVLACSPGLLDLLPTRLNALRQQRLFEMEPARLARIEMQSSGIGFIRLVRDGRQWRITQPVQGLADQATIEGILDVLLHARIRKFLWDPVAGAAETRASRALAYGVTRDGATVAVQVWESGDQVGSEVLLGRQLEGDESLVAAVRSDMPGIIAMDASLIHDLKVPLSALRDSSLWDLNLEDVKTFALTGAERHVSFSQENKGEWRMTEPIQDKADAPVIKDLLSRALSLKAAGYVEGIVTNFAAYGLDRPMCVLEIESETGTTTRLKVGKFAEHGTLSYARVNENPEVVRIPTIALPELSLQAWDPRDYRDKTIMRVDPSKVDTIRLQMGDADEQVAERDEAGDWKTTVPLPGILDEDAVSALLRRVSPLRAGRVAELAVRDPVAFGMDAPWVVLTLGIDQGSAINRVLLVGRRTAEGGRYAMLRGGDVLFVLSRQQIDALARPIVVKP